MAKTHEESKPLTWQDLKETAFGRIRLRPWEFYNYTFEEFLITMKGFFIEDTEQWKRARLSAWAAIAPHVKRIPTPEKWLPLPGEGHYRAGATKDDIMKKRQELFDKGIFKHRLN